MSSRGFTKALEIRAPCFVHGTREIVVTQAMQKARRFHPETCCGEHWRILEPRQREPLTPTFRSPIRHRALLLFSRMWGVQRSSDSRRCAYCDNILTIGILWLTEPQMFMSPSQFQSCEEANHHITACPRFINRL